MKDYSHPLAAGACFLKRIQLRLSMALFLAVATGAHATELLNIDFDDGYTTGSIFGQSGTSTTLGGTEYNLTGTWVPPSTYSSGFSPTADVVAANTTTDGVSNDLTYDVSGGGTISSGSNVLQYTSGGGGQDNVLQRALTTAISGENVYLRMVIDPIIPTTTYGTTVTTLTFNLSSVVFGQYGTTNGANSGVGLLSSGVSGDNASYAGAKVGSNPLTGSPPGTSVTTTVSLSIGTPTLLVAEFVWDPAANSGKGGYDQVNLWVDPTAGASSTPDSSSAITSSSVASFKDIGLDVANLSSSPTPPVYDFDSIEAGTTWADVVPTSAPKPSPSRSSVGASAVR